jgi:signal peptidase I
VGGPRRPRRPASAATGSRPYPALSVTDPQPEPTASNRRALGCLIEIVETVVLTAIIFIVLQTFVGQPFKVEQVSMQDTIEEGQYVLVDKLTPRFDGYHRGDIIVFTPPANVETPAGKPYIKRIVGVAGDRIEIRDGRVFVNGIALDEPYVYTVDGTPQPTTPHGEVSEWTVPAGDLFVMGDHRERSADSRDFGPIQLRDVVGRAWLRYWPISDLGILPTDRHPELARPAGASPSPSSRASARPSAR